MKKTTRPPSADTTRKKGKRKPYRPARPMRIGKARALVQGRTHGKYADAYSGYYWEG